MRLPFLLLIFACNSGYGFVVSGNFWEAGQAVYHVGITGVSPSGTSWNTAFKRAMDTWTTQTNFKFVAIDSFKDPCAGRANGGFGDNASGIAFTADVCGNAFGTNTIAVTLTAGVCLNPQCTGGFKIRDADIVFKTDETWDVYTGPQRFNNVDFERVALHELGHALGLRHEVTNSAIMQAKVTDNHTLQIDDINGANAIYPGSGTPPATTISSIYGVNITVPASSTLAGPNHTISQNGSLGAGDATIDGKLIDLYQFTFRNDSAVDLQLNSSAHDPFLYLVRITSTQDAHPEYTFTDDNSGGGANARISTTIQAGTYWVGVSTASAGQQGAYSLSLIAANSNPTSSFQSFQSIYGVGVQINPNPSIVGALNTTDFALNGKRLDLYQFSVVNQTRVRIDLSSSAFDTVLLLTRLLPSVFLGTQEIDESFLFQDDDGGSGTNSRLEPVLSPGNYWIGVTSAFTGATGDYQIETTVLVP